MIRLRTLRFGALFAPLAALVLLASLAVPAQAAGQWTATGTMVYGPASHATARLADGRVLVPGGTTFSGPVITCSLRDTQIFDPATSTWSVTGNMATGRALHTATTLNDGRVLVAGGVDCTIYISVVYASAEIFDPATGAWTATGNMGTARFNHTATLLNDGRVLVVSGSTAEIYNPVTGMWGPTANLGTTRVGHTATLLNDGRVLVAGGVVGGFASSSVEIFDPATSAWTATGSLGTARWDHATTLLSDGRVLIAGGRADEGGNFVPLVSAEIFDPATGIWVVSGSMSTPRSSLSMTRLNDGRVLSAGGLTNGSTLASAEIFDPATDIWTSIGSMIDDRRSHTATLLNDGRVLAVGGSGSGQCCAELFTLSGGGGTPTPTPTPPPGGDDMIYVSSTTNGTAGGVSFADEDILSYDTGSGVWSMVFDGSDVGVTGDVDAFALMSDGSLLLSLDAAASIGNLGTVADSDIVRFVPTSLGSNTAGTFEWYFDGSDVGLTTSAEDIDAIDFAPDGWLIVGTIGSFSVTGVSGNDEDLLAFMPTSLGTATSGTWTLYFDGSDVDLNTSSSEDVNGTWIDAVTGDVYLTTLGAFSVTGASGDGADIFICTPVSLGPTTACTFIMYWDGSANGFNGEVADGIHIAP